MKTESSETGPPPRPSNSGAIAILAAIVVIALIVMAIIKGSRPSRSHEPARSPATPTEAPGSNPSPPNESPSPRIQPGS